MLHSITLTAIVSVLSVAVPMAVDARTYTQEEKKVKVALLAKLGQFVTWPKSSDRFSICLFGQNPFGNVLEHLRGKNVGGQPITIRRLRTFRFNACHVLFVSHTEEDRLAAVLRAVPPTVLTVSDIDRFAERGGIVGLRTVTKDKKWGRIKIEINMDQVNKSELKISSRLLRLARIVGGNGAHEKTAP